jgi:predicted PurR-regulated permease PerM
MNYIFDNNGPDWSECDKWIDELHPIKSMFYASEVTEKIISNTERNNSIISNVKMAQIVARVEDIQRFVNNQKDNSLESAKSITKKITRILSNILDQKYAWINSTVEQKINTSTEILIIIQLTGFMVAHQQDE